MSRPRVGEGLGEVVGFDAGRRRREPVERVHGLEGGGGDFVGMGPAVVATLRGLSERGECLGLESGEYIWRDACLYGELGDGSLCVADEGGMASSPAISSDSSQSANVASLRS